MHLRTVASEKSPAASDLSFPAKGQTEARGASDTHQWTSEGCQAREAVVA